MEPEAESTESKPPRRWVLPALLLVSFLLHVTAEATRGTLTPTVRGLVFWPLLTACGASLLLGAALRLGQGAWKQALVPLAFLALMVGAVTHGWLAQRLIFRVGAEPLPGSIPDGRIVSYPSPAGVELRGAVVPGHGPAPRPVLVWFHGNGVSANFSLGPARLFAERGIDVFVAEYRGFGGVPGLPTEEGLLADARAALPIVERELGVGSADLLLGGRSLGTGVAARLAAEGIGRGVVLISPYTSIVELGGQLAPSPLFRLATDARFDSRAHLAATQVPVLILHGTEDRIIPFPFGRRLADGLGSRARFVPLEGAGHNDLFGLAGEQVAREVGGFARRNGARR